MNQPEIILNLAHGNADSLDFLKRAREKKGNMYAVFQLIPYPMVAGKKISSSKVRIPVFQYHRKFILNGQDFLFFNFGKKK